MRLTSKEVKHEHSPSIHKEMCTNTIFCHRFKCKEASSSLAEPIAVAYSSLLRRPQKLQPVAQHV